MSWPARIVVCGCEVERLRTENARLNDRIRDLERKVDELARAAKRQSAPFSKGTPKCYPKTAGRKPGDPRPRTRRVTPDRVDERIEVLFASALCRI